MRILFVAPFLRVPADFGIAVRNYELLKHLTERHQLTVITYGEDDTGQTDSWLIERGARVVRLPYSLPWSSDKSRTASLRNLFYYPPASFQRFSPKVLSDSITACLAEEPEIDLIVFDTELAGQAVLKKKFAKPHVLVVHDIYHVMLRRDFQTMAWRPFKLVKLINWLKTSYYERRILSRHENLMAVSSADEMFLKEHYPKASTYLVTNGVDTEAFSRNGQPKDPNTILFVGAFEYEPNVDAFFYFCREILPLVRAKRPEAQFVAVGRHPNDAMREYAQANTGITLTDTVPDVRPYYARASLAVIPLRVGSGMKLKTLEAFGMGVPVVSTSIGCEGLEVENGIHCAVADTAQTFAEQAVELLARPERARELAQSAWQLVAKSYDWKQIATEFESSLERIAGVETNANTCQRGEDVEACSLCSKVLRPTSESYDSKVVFEMWNATGVSFSPQVTQAPKIPKRVTLHECKNCGFGVFLPCWTGSPGFYEELSGEADYYLADKWEFQLALRDLKNCESVLEVGCGDGRFLEQLSCNQTIGLEENQLAIARAREKGLSVLNVTLKEFAQKHAHEFDGVCAFQVLEHVPDPIEFLGAMKDCLKPNGLMALAVPNARGILKFVRPVPTDLPPHHVTRWEARCFDHLRKLGLQLIALRLEPLDAPRFHWILRWWDHACGIARDEHASWIENFRKHPLWLIGNVTLHYGLQLLRLVGVKELPVQGHSLYALLSRRP